MPQKTPKTKIRTKKSGRKAKKNSIRPALRKSAILSEAHDIILNEGHEALSLRYLASRLKVTAAALYAHVDNKLDLMRLLAEAEYDRRADLYESIETRDPFERLRAISHAYVKASRKQPNIFRFLLLFPPIGAWDAPEDTLPAGNRAFNVASGAVDDAIAEGLLRNDDPFMMSISIWTSVHGVASFIIQGSSFITDISDELLDNVVGSVLLGLSANEDAKRRIRYVFGGNKPKGNRSQNAKIE